MPRRSASFSIAAIALAVALRGHAAAAPAADPDGPAGPRGVSSAADPPGKIRFRSFGAADGLRNLVVWALAQDGAGTIWVGTDDGAYRYDGKQFAHYSVQDGLLSSAVTVLGVAPDGQACAGGARGMVCWNAATHRFDDTGAKGLPTAAIRAIARREAQLWVGTDDGLYVRDGNAAFVRAPGWPGDGRAVPALWADARGVVAAFATTVVRGDGRGAWQLGDVDLGTDPIDGVARDRAGVIWIRSAIRIWAWSPDAGWLHDLSEGIPPSHEAAGRAAPLTVSPTDEVWLGTDGGVAYRRDDRWHLVSRAAGLPIALARSVLVDREGTTWVGATGLFQWAGRSLIERHDAASGLPGDVTWSAGRDRDGVLWAGTDRCLARGVNGAWRCQPHTTERIIRAVVAMPDGGMFIGGAPGDLLYLDPSGAARSITPRPFHPEDHILTLALEPGGDLWVGTRSGLYRLHDATPGPLDRVVIPGVGPTTRLSQLLYVDGRLWATTERGLAVREADRWRVLGVADGLRARSTRYLLRRSDGRVCVSYTEAIGLSCFHYDGARLTAITHLGEPDGLAAGMVYSLGEDREHRLWVGTGNGVDVVTPGGLDHFGEADGLAGNDSAATAFFFDADGSVWIGASGGVSHLQANHYHGFVPPPHARIVAGRLGGQPIQLDAQQPTQAPHDASSLLVEYVADSFLDPDRLEFQTRLGPVERDWSTNPTREVRTPALPPGSYRLEVRARLGTGPWGPTAELRFDVRAAWWQTRWLVAALIIALLCASAVAFAWRYRAMVRRRTRELIAQADASFHAHVDSIPDVVAVYRGTALVFLNAAACAFFGARVDPRDRVHDEDRDALARLVTDTIGAEPARSTEVVEVRLCGGDGVWRLCEVSSLRLRYGGGPVMVVSGRDVTERQRMRAQLLISDRMASVGTLAAGIAHEINNPLTYVSGNLDLLGELLDGDRVLSDADRREATMAVGDAREGAARVKKIVKELSSFNRCQVEHRVALELATLVERATKLTQNETRHHAQLVIELGATPRVIADDGRLTQVLINLLVNAAQAVPPGHADQHRVIVRTRTDDRGHAVIEVEDTGPGMSTQVRARAFDPFFTTKDVGQGTGLGLSICHTIISSLGGQISIETGSLGGCLVRVTLPPAALDDASAPRAAPVSAPPAPPASSRRRVLLIDDDPRVTSALERVLQKDHDVTTASSGELAVRWIADGARFDAIVSDVMMPTMTGLDAYDDVAACAHDQARRFVFLSGGVFSDNLRTRLDATGAQQLDKPVTPTELRAAIAQVAGR